MDDPSLPAEEHMAALDALSRINVLSRTASQLATGIERVVLGETDASGEASSPTRPLRIVDIACGGGDVTIALAKRLARLKERGVIGSVTVTGIDMSHRAIERAKTLEAEAGVEGVDFAVHDIVADGCPPCDVATSSLFLHHLDDAVADSVLRGMAAAARCGVVVSDLVRSGTGLALAVLTTTLVCRSRVARVDGPLSVRAARTPAEYRSICDGAGLHGAVLRRCWPERIMIEWRKTGRERPRPGEA